MGGVATHAFSPSTPDCWRYDRVVSREEIGVDLMALCNGESVAWMTAQATLLLPPLRGAATHSHTNAELLSDIGARFGLSFPDCTRPGPPYYTSTAAYGTDSPYEVVFEGARVWLARTGTLVVALADAHDPGGPQGAALIARLNALGPWAMEPYLLEFLWPLHEIQNARIALAEFAR